jgi:hypothetical protein
MKAKEEPMETAPSASIMNAAPTELADATDMQSPTSDPED